MKPERTKEEILLSAFEGRESDLSDFDKRVILEAMEEYRSPVESKWVSVDKELPAKGRKVLVFDGDGSVSIAARPMDWEFTAMKEVWEYLSDSCFDSADWHYPSTTVTHWQPLPELPPIEETKEK